MNAFLNLGKWLYAVPFLIFGAFHFMNAKAMAGMAPFGGEIMVYISGLALVAAAVSMFIGKMDKLATVLLAILLLIFVFTIHAPNAMSDDPGMQQMGTSNALKDLALAGAALMYAKHFAKDNAIIG